MVKSVIRVSRSSREVKSPRRRSFRVRTLNHCSIIMLALDRVSSTCCYVTISGVSHLSSMPSFTGSAVSDAACFALASSEAFVR
jgi:hypothetical protein